MTTVLDWNGFYGKNMTRNADICDDCALIAYDKGVSGWDAQVAFMVNAGDMVDEHLCIAKEEPSSGVQCDCGCRSI